MEISIFATDYTRRSLDDGMWVGSKTFWKAFTYA